MVKFNADKFVEWVESNSKNGKWIQEFKDDPAEAYNYATKLRAMIGDSGVATVVASGTRVTVTLVKEAIAH